ncbi:hypothetical protein CDL12_28041 [Handroanthus impetiginosus]|uniref:Uncharacterized protein n=1 Tax=Handroanthus impetiginosus TaxID=429701 RepID=A0A2G9G2E7_9LAMI|nr:hypothetical protein CDL12_28041 [Handroanthus impetiginosus]
MVSQHKSLSVYHVEYQYHGLVMQHQYHGLVMQHQLIMHNIKHFNQHNVK